MSPKRWFERVLKNENAFFYLGCLAVILVFAVFSVPYSSHCKPIEVSANKSDFGRYSDDVKRRIQEALKPSGVFSVFGTSDNVAPFIRMKANYRLAPEYQLAFCDIEKSMSTLMVGIFCYLFDTANFNSNNRTIATEWWDTRFCQGRNEVWSTEAIRRYMPEPHTTLYIVREPVERFVSAFLDKCINELHVRPDNCFGCKGDVDCVLPAVYAQIKDYGLGKLTWAADPAEPRPYDVRHFAPQTWYCDLEDRYLSYQFIKYASDGEAKLKMVLHISEVLREQGVPEYKIETVRDSILGGQLTLHATHGSSMADILRDRIRNNPEYVRMIHEMYEMDYRIFDFPKPF